jgi:hypothetical protein
VDKALIAIKDSPAGRGEPAIGGLRLHHRRRP